MRFLKIDISIDEWSDQKHDQNGKNYIPLRSHSGIETIYHI